MKCTLNPNLGKIEVSKTDKERSIVLTNEKVYAVFEYVPDKIIVSLALTNLLIVHNWMPQRLIQRNSYGNIYKNYFAPLPDFDEHKFPFVACSGFEHISLINVHDMAM